MFDFSEARTHLAERHQDYERLAKLMKQFMAWKFLDSFDQGALPILQNAEHRVKSLNSLKLNLDAGVYEKAGYSSPSDIPDLAGARIIAYFVDDLKIFATRDNIQKLFGVKATENLVDYKADGYRSWHFDAIVGEDCEFWRALRASDRDRLHGLRCENQMRTVIQHGFAEANHELNYKYRLRTGNDLREEHRVSWIQAGEELQDVDDKILLLKGDLAVDPAFRDNPHAMTEFKYSAPSIPQGAWERAGIAYPYVMLDIQEPDMDLPKVAVRDSLFSINSELEALGADQDYKNKMWARLEVVEPEALSSITYDSMVPRVCGWDGETRTVTVQPAFYSDQVVSNHKFALDKEVFGIGRKIRELAYDADGYLLPYERCPLSNTLGASVVMLTRDKKWVVSHRGQRVAFDPGILGTSSSGAVEWNELGNWGKRDFKSWFGGGILREIGEELGVDTMSEAIHASIHERLVFLGFGREAGRAGKPQLFFFLEEPDKDFDDLKEMWRIYAENVVKKEGQEPEFKDVTGITHEQAEMLISGDPDVVLKGLKDIKIGTSVSEELRTNLALAFNYLGL